MTTQTQPVQPEALRLAAWLNEGAWHNITLGDVNAAGRELCRQHARIAELEAELVREAQRTAAEKQRADQMTEQHRMQAAMNSEARAELAQLRESKPLSDCQIEALRSARNLAMRHAAAARIPECGEFGKIAQDLDAVLGGIGEKTP